MWQSGFYPDFREAFLSLVGTFIWLAENN